MELKCPCCGKTITFDIVGRYSELLDLKLPEAVNIKVKPE